MSTKKSDKINFLLVVFGIFLVIGFIAGGVTVLDNQGLISAGGDMPERELSADGTAADLAEVTVTLPPTGGHDEASGLSIQSLMGLLMAVGQIGLVVVLIAGGQWLYARLNAHRIHPKTG